VDDGLRLAVPLTPYWDTRGYLSEGRRWLETVLAASRTDSTVPALHMRALFAAGSLAKLEGDLDASERQLTDALTAT